MLAAGAVLAAAGLAAVQARQLARPLERVAATAARFGDGDFSSSKLPADADPRDRPDHQRAARERRPGRSHAVDRAPLHRRCDAPTPQWADRHLDALRDPRPLSQSRGRGRGAGRALTDRATQRDHRRTARRHARQHDPGADDVRPDHGRRRPRRRMEPAIRRGAAVARGRSRWRPRASSAPRDSPAR